MSVSNEDDSSAASVPVDAPVIQNPYENKTLLVNEMLFYISHFVNCGSATPDNIRRIVLSSFDEEE